MSDDGIKYYWSGVSIPFMGFVGSLEILCVIFMFMSKSFITYLCIGVILFFILLLFFSLKVTVDYNNLYITYGIGIFEKIIPLTEIKGKRIVPNKDSTLCLAYNMSANEAVMLELRSGERLYVPADNSRRFQSALSIMG